MALVVDGLGEDVLADAALPQDHDIAVRARQESGPLDAVFHDGAVAHDVLERDDRVVAGLVRDLVGDVLAGRDRQEQALGFELRVGRRDGRDDPAELTALHLDRDLPIPDFLLVVDDLPEPGVIRKRVDQFVDRLEIAVPALQRLDLQDFKELAVVVGHGDRAVSGVDIELDDARRVPLIGVAGVPGCADADVDGAGDRQSRHHEGVGPALQGADPGDTAHVQEDALFHDLQGGIIDRQILQERKIVVLPRRLHGAALCIADRCRVSAGHVRPPHAAQNDSLVLQKTPEISRGPHLNGTALRIQQQKGAVTGLHAGCHVGKKMGRIGPEHAHVPPAGDQVSLRCPHHAGEVFVNMFFLRALPVSL